METVDRGGLDMYAHKVRGDYPDFIEAYADYRNPLIREIEEKSEIIAYWYKHPNLHRWMERLYYERGGSNVFNGVYTRLRKLDIKQLEAAALFDALPISTGGHFFGKSSFDDRATDLEFVAAAKEAIAEGFKIYYYSSW
jgi:hypothetical protein